MPNLGVFHPQIVHFVIALLVVGVAFRVISLTKIARFTNPAAATLLVAGAVAAILAVSSGQRAHGAVERIPGAREAVEVHEEWGERTRDIFIVVGLIELAIIGIGRRNERGKLAMGLRAASALIGLVGVYAIYETGEHGGDLVYSYAGGVGTRSGDPADVQRLLVAGLYNEAMVARKEGDGARAASLIDQLATLKQGEPGIAFLRVQSMIEDRNQPRQALATLDSIAAAARPEDRFTTFRVQRLRADAYEKLGMPDSAKAINDALQQQMQQFRRGGG